jgi:hypothetical protein
VKSAGTAVGVEEAVSALPAKVVVKTITFAAMSDRHNSVARGMTSRSGITASFAPYHSEMTRRSWGHHRRQSHRLLSLRRCSDGRRRQPTLARRRVGVCGPPQP